MNAVSHVLGIYCCIELTKYMLISAKTNNITEKEVHENVMVISHPFNTYHYWRVQQQHYKYLSRGTRTDKAHAKVNMQYSQAIASFFMLQPKRKEDRS